MKKRVIVLTVMFIFAWTFPLTHSVQLDVKVGKPVHQIAQTKATWVQKHQNKVMTMRFAKAGWNWNSKERRCLYSLFMIESKFDHLADNPKSSAFGIGQVLKETSKQPEIQILHAFKYIEHRYGTPCRAWYHHRLGWY